MAPQADSADPQGAGRTYHRTKSSSAANHPWHHNDRSGNFIYRCECGMMYAEDGKRYMR